jgi:guanylate kinase
MASPASGKLSLIIGPSGVGKSAVIRTLRQRHPEWHYPRSATTRTRRQGEGDENYYFLSNEQFDVWLAEGRFLEWQVVHQTARYGTLKSEILDPVDAGKTVIREIEVQGFVSLLSDPHFSPAGGPRRLQSIFLKPESTEQLVAHITHRAPIGQDELQHRLHSMQMELAHADQCDATIVNHEGQLKRTIDAVEELVIGA